GGNRAAVGLQGAVGGHDRSGDGGDLVADDAEGAGGAVVAAGGGLVADPGVQEPGDVVDLGASAVFSGVGVQHDGRAVGGDGEGAVPVDVVGELAQRPGECLPGLGVGGVEHRLVPFRCGGSGDGGSRACGGGGEPLGAAGPGGVVGQGPDVGVGQVGGLDPLGDAAFGDQQRFAGVDRADVGGGESGAGPAVAEDDVGGAGGGAAARGAVAEQVPQALGNDVDRGPLGGGDDGHGGGAAAGHQVAEQGHELALFLLRAEHGGEDGDLIEDRGDDGQAVGGFDLAAAVGAEPGVPVFHHFLQPEQGDDGAADVGSDEFVGGLVPHAELDVFGVEQHHPTAGGQGGVGGHGVEQAGFAAAGFARGEQVLVDQADVEGLAEFVAAHVDGVVHGQHRPDRDSASCGAGHGGSPCGEAGEPQAGQGRGVGFLRMGDELPARPQGRNGPVAGWPRGGWN